MKIRGGTGCGFPPFLSQGPILAAGALEDSLDYEGMMEAKEKHGKHMNQFSDEIRRRFPGALIIGDSQCQQCKVCTYPNAPCRFPIKNLLPCLLSA